MKEPSIRKWLRETSIRDRPERSCSVGDVRPTRPGSDRRGAYELVSLEWPGTPGVLIDAVQRAATSNGEQIDDELIRNLSSNTALREKLAAVFSFSSTIGTIDTLFKDEVGYNKARLP